MKLIVGCKYRHKFRGECVYTEACAYAQATNPDSTSVFMEFDGEMEEVTMALIKEGEDHG